MAKKIRKSTSFSRKQYQNLIKSFLSVKEGPQAKKVRGISLYMDHGLMEIAILLKIVYFIKRLFTLLTAPTGPPVLLLLWTVTAHPLSVWLSLNLTKFTGQLVSYPIKLLQRKKVTKGKKVPKTSLLLNFYLTYLLSFEGMTENLLLININFVTSVNLIREYFNVNYIITGLGVELGLNLYFGYRSGSVLGLVPIALHFVGMVMFRAKFYIIFQHLLGYFVQELNNYTKKSIELLSIIENLSSPTFVLRKTDFKMLIKNRSSLGVLGDKDTSKSFRTSYYQIGRSFSTSNLSQNAEFKDCFSREGWTVLKNHIEDLKQQAQKDPDLGSRRILNVEARPGGEEEPLSYDVKLSIIEWDQRDVILAELLPCQVSEKKRGDGLEEFLESNERLAEDYKKQFFEAKRQFERPEMREKNLQRKGILRIFMGFVSSKWSIFDSQVGLARIMRLGREGKSKIELRLVSRDEFIGRLENLKSEIIIQNQTCRNDITMTFANFAKNGCYLDIDSIIPILRRTIFLMIKKNFMNNLLIELQMKQVAGKKFYLELKITGKQTKFFKKSSLDVFFEENHEEDSAGGASLKVNNSYNKGISLNRSSIANSEVYTPSSRKVRESTKSLRTLFARVKKEESPTFLQEGFDKNVLLYYKKKLNAVFKIYDYDEEDSEEKVVQFTQFGLMIPIPEYLDGTKKQKRTKLIYEVDNNSINLLGDENINNTAISNPLVNAGGCSIISAKNQGVPPERLLSSITNEIKGLSLTQDIAFFDLVRDSLKQASVFKEHLSSLGALDNIMSSCKQTEISRRRQSPFSISGSHSMTPRAAYKVKALGMPTLKSISRGQDTEKSSGENIEVVNTHFKKQPDFRHTDMPKTKRKLYRPNVEIIFEDSAQEHAPSSNMSQCGTDRGFDLGESVEKAKVMLPFNLEENSLIRPLLKKSAGNEDESKDEIDLDVKKLMSKGSFNKSSSKPIIDQQHQKKSKTPENKPNTKQPKKTKEADKESEKSNFKEFTPTKEKIDTLRNYLKEIGGSITSSNREISFPEKKNKNFSEAHSKKVNAKSQRNIKKSKLLDQKPTNKTLLIPELVREDSVSDKEDQPTRAHDLDKVDIMNPKTAILDEKELSSGVKPSAGEKGVKKPPKSKLVRSFTPKVPEFAKTSPAAKDKLKLPLMKEFEISLGFGDAFNLGELVKQMALLFLENRKFSESINNNILTPIHSSTSRILMTPGMVKTYLGGKKNSKQTFTTLKSVPEEREQTNIESTSPTLTSARQRPLPPNKLNSSLANNTSIISAPSSVEKSRRTTHRRKWLVGQMTIKLCKKVTVLVVDDSELERNMLTRLIRNYSQEIKIDIARDGYEGYKKVEALYKGGHRYHIVFIDLNMPNCNGFDSISKIRQYESRNNIDYSEVCLLSADDVLDDMEHLEEDGESKLVTYEIQRFFKKPLSKQILGTIMKSIGF